MPKTYQIEKILDKKLVNNKAYYLIKWEGFSHKDCTWEPIENLRHVMYLIEEFEEAVEEGDGESQQYSCPVPDIKVFINPKLTTRSSIQKSTQQQKTQNKQQVPNNKKSIGTKKKQIPNSNQPTIPQEAKIILIQEPKQVVEEQQNKSTSTQVIKEVNTRKLLRRRIRGVLNPFEEQLDALIQNVRKQLKTEVLGLFEHNDSVIDPHNGTRKILVSREVQTDIQSEAFIAEQNDRFQRQQIKDFIQYFSTIQGPCNMKPSMDVQQQEIPVIIQKEKEKDFEKENQKQNIQQIITVPTNINELANKQQQDTSSTNIQINQTSILQRQNVEQDKPLLQEEVSEVAKSDLKGSFLNGNKIHTIVKGIVDQKDGVRKYLVKWVQEEGKGKQQCINFFQEIKDCWVNEYALLDFACKDLAKFFLSRIKWGTK